MRYCEFPAGDFVEPIAVWNPPNQLAFDVEDQPRPPTELSHWEDVHPPHLVLHPDLILGLAVLALATVEPSRTMANAKIA